MASRCAIDPVEDCRGQRQTQVQESNRFLDIARDSALECAAIQDVLVASEELDSVTNQQLKRILHRIVSMLRRLIGRADVVAEPITDYKAAIEYEYRDAEYEYEYEKEQPEPRIAPQMRRRFSPNRVHRASVNSTVRRT